MVLFLPEKYSLIQRTFALSCVTLFITGECITKSGLAAVILMRLLIRIITTGELSLSNTYTVLCRYITMFMSFSTAAGCPTFITTQVI